MRNGMMPRLRRWLRAHGPVGWRVKWAGIRRALRDGISGDRRRFAHPGRQGGAWHPLLSLTQTIKRSPYWEGKLVNIRLAAARLDGTHVAPGEILSFWRLIGEPCAARGFALGRAIHGDAVRGEIGGGLCQVSGILYEAGLRAGMAVLERHPHSRDLYTEEERFAALGLDAAVVWPWKDLRLASLPGTALRFTVKVDAMRLTVAVDTAHPIAPAALTIERTDLSHHRDVRLYRRTAAGVTERISEDRYLIGSG